ncbi:MAG: hypothetical protein J6W67_05020, partial [Lentisphaeria bacterium]|nr:hypothetical protein [Lentisphaeria bacterium]
LKNSDVILFGSVEVLFDSGSSDDENAGGVFASTSVNLDLSSLDGNMSSVPRLDSLNPLSDQEVKRNKMVRLVIIGLCSLAGIGVISLLVYSAIQMLRLGGN